MRPFRLAVLGGTFDHLHVGHHALLASAFDVGREVAIGLTTDRFVAENAKPDVARVQSYTVRRAALARWLGRSFPGRDWRIVPLENSFGRSVEPEVDVLVVSRDTEAGGREVNRERRRLGRRTIPLVIVPLALADDLEPVSSRRVRAGMIGTDGRRFTPIRIAISARDPNDRTAAERAVKRVFPQARTNDGGAPGGPAHPAPDLTLSVARRAAGGWTARERSPFVRLRPRVILGDRPADLERGLVALLRPRQERKVFGTFRS